jgi:acetamidase/formamidase
MIPVSVLNTSTLAPTPALLPNTPQAPSLAAGIGSDITVTWTDATVDSTHSAATGFNLRSGPSGTGNWTTVSNITSPYLLSGQATGTAIDVQIQSVNLAGTSPWSATVTLTTATALPNIPATPSLAHGTGTDLAVSWATPTVDSTHSAATAFNLQFSPSGLNPTFATGPRFREFWAC